MCGLYDAAHLFMLSLQAFGGLGCPAEAQARLFGEEFPSDLTLVLPVELAGFPRYVLHHRDRSLHASSPMLVHLDQGEMNGPASSAG